MNDDRKNSPFERKPISTLYAQGPRRGGGRRRRRGRGVGRPRIQPDLPTDWSNLEGQAKLVLKQHELEVIRLLDIENKTQAEVGEILGVSRATIWRYASKAREKIAKAITSASKISITIEDEQR